MRKKVSNQVISLFLAVIMLFGVFATNGANTVKAADGAENYPLNSIVIKLEDIITHQMLGGGRFEIYFSNDAQSGGYGTLIASVDTDSSGVLNIILTAHIPARRAIGYG